MTNSQKSIISFDDNDFIYLTNVSSESYEYSLTYSVDLEQTLKKNALCVEMVFTNDQIQTPTSNIFNSFSTNQDIVQNILLSSANLKTQATAQNGIIVAKFVSDISAHIDNTKINQILSGKLQSKQVPIATAASVNNSDGASVSEFKFSGAYVFKTLSNTLGVDPTSLFNSSTFTNTLVNNNLNPILPLIRNINFTAEAAPSVQSQVEQIILTNITETVKIPISKINVDKFWVKLTLYDDNKNIIDAFSKLIDNSFLLSVYYQPTQAPILYVAPLNNKNVVQIKQIDSKATGVYLYKKTLHTDTKKNTDYKYIGEIDIINGQTARMEDVISGYNPIVYRAVSVGPNDTLSSEFSNFQIKPKLDGDYFNQSVRRSQRSTTVLLTYTMLSDGIKLEVNDVPEEIMLISFLRKDLTLFEQSATKIDSYLEINDKTASVYYVIDNAVKSGHLYEYNCSFLYRDGTTRESDNFIIAEFIKKTSNKSANTTASPAEINKTGQFIDIQFTLQTQFSQEKHDTIKTALKQQNLLPYYNTVFEDNKQQLQDVAAYRVIRTNLTTGDLDDFGVINSNQFSDLNCGAIKNISPLEDGCDYRYTVITYIRAPETILDVTRDVKKDDGSVLYSFKPAKWLHPNTLFKGNLSSPKTILDKHGKDEFMFGDVVSTTIINISFSGSLPYVNEVIAKKINNNVVFVEWQVRGMQSKIDYFTLFATTSEGTVFVGKAHNISINGNYRYIDTIKNNKNKGSIIYSVLPIYNDYSYGVAVKANNSILVS